MFLEIDCGQSMSTLNSLTSINVFGNRLTLCDLWDSQLPQSIRLGKTPNTELEVVPSGKCLHYYGKSPFLLGKFIINDHFQWQITILTGKTHDVELPEGV